MRCPCNVASKTALPPQYDRSVVEASVGDRIDRAAAPADEVHGPAPGPIKHFGVGPGNDIGGGGASGKKSAGVKKRGKTVFGRGSEGRTKTAETLKDEGLGQSEETSTPNDGSGRWVPGSVEGRGGGEGRGGERVEGMGGGGGGRRRGEEAAAEAGGDGGGGVGGGGEGDLKGSKAAGQMARGAFRDPADGVEMEFTVAGQGAGPLERFVAAGKKLPIVLLTCNRETLLRRTIEVRHTRKLLPIECCLL